jgi:hypothetical protein
MKIRICKENRDKIQKALDAVQQKCKERTITVDDIIYSVKDIQDNLKIAKKAMIGIKVESDQCCQNFPNAYKYTPYSTQYVMECTSTGWFLTWVDRKPTKRSGNQYNLTLTEDAKKALVERFTKF